MRCLVMFGFIWFSFHKMAVWQVVQTGLKAENMVCFQEMVSESTTRTVLRNLLPNTRYSVTVVPVYAEGDGPSLSDSGKTSEY